MPGTPNSIIAPQSLSSFGAQLAAGAVTITDLGAATANGRLIYKILVYPGAADREVTVYVHDGTAARLLCLTDIGADAAADVIPEDAIANVPLPLDANGNKVLYLAAGQKLQVVAEDVAQTNDVFVICQDL